jgi:hypothetical protein
MGTLLPPTGCGFSPFTLGTKTLPVGLESGLPRRIGGKKPVFLGILAGFGLYFRLGNH